MLKEREQTGAVNTPDLIGAFRVLSAFELDVLPALAMKKLVFGQAGHRVCVVRGRCPPTVFEPISGYAYVSNYLIAPGDQVKAGGFRRPDCSVEDVELGLKPWPDSRALSYVSLPAPASYAMNTDDGCRRMENRVGVFDVF